MNDYETIKQMKMKAVDILLESEDYSNYKLEYILANKDDETRAIAVASHYDEIAQIDLSTNEISQIPDWDYNIDEYIFNELENGNFGEYENISYFGIEKNEKSDELRDQVEVLYYENKENFAIKLKTKQEDEVILCKNPEGKTFNEIYETIINKEKTYKGNKNIENGELVKVPNLKIDEKKEFTEIEEKPFLFSNDDTYVIEKAMQTIKFELDKTGGKIKSEAGMMANKATAVIMEEKREFAIDNTFAIFLKEEGKDKPYFAGKINDITKFQ